MKRTIALVLVALVLGCSDSQPAAPVDAAVAYDLSAAPVDLSPAAGCGPNAQCPDPTPCREPKSWACVACLPSEDVCTGGTWCVPTFQCVGACASDGDCGGDPSVKCCAGLCVDVTRDVGNCGGCGMGCGGTCAASQCVLSDGGAPDLGGVTECGARVSCAHGAGLTVEALASPADLLGAVGDLDGDGRPDLVVINSYDNFISVLLNRGLGHFAPRADYVVGNRPIRVAIGDLDGDGKPDLAVANHFAGTVSVLINEGGGRFGPKSDLLTGTQASAVAIADLDGDGQNDLAVTDDTKATLAVLVNNGGGHFGMARPYTTDASPVAIAIGDFDGDGKPDLATGDFGSGQAISVFLNQGNAVFGTAQNLAFPNGLHAAFLAAGDLDGDGKVDLVGGNAQGGTIAFATFHNTGSGFAAGTPYNSAGGGYYTTGLALADLNGDGKLDVALGSGTNFLVYLNQGAGAFPATPAQYAAGGNTALVAAADLNGDGKLDLATQTDQHLLTLLWNAGAGSYTAQKNTSAGKFSPGVLLTDDFNRDGRPDVALLDGSGTGVAVMLNAGGGAFAAAVPYAASFGTLASGDVDGDGFPELIVANSNTNVVSVLHNDGHGAFPTRSDYPTGTRPYGVVVGDLDGDGKRDLAVVHNGDSTVGVFLNSGTGTFPSRSDRPVAASPSAIAIADLDGDGKLDLAITSSSDNLVELLFNQGGAVFSIEDATTVGNPQAIAIADLDGDGKAEVIAGSSGTIGVHRNLGARTFAPHIEYPTGPGANATALAIGDLDGDCRPDVIAGKNGVEVHFNAGGATLGAFVDFTSTNSAGVAIADFDGDGMLDLVTNFSTPPSQVAMVPQVCF